MSDGGKGDGSRRMDISQEEYGNRHETIFGVRKRERWIPPPIGGSNGNSRHSGTDRVLDADGMNGVEDTQGVGSVVRDEAI